MRKGVTFDVNGVRHEMRFGVSALCELEARFGVAMADIGARLGVEKPHLSDLRTAFAAGLGVSDDEASDIMDGVGLVRAGQLIGEALTLAFGADAKPAEDAAAGKPKAAA